VHLKSAEPVAPTSITKKSEKQTPKPCLPLSNGKRHPRTATTKPKKKKKERKLASDI
jgi:hypothetical protein